MPNAAEGATQVSDGGMWDGAQGNHDLPDGVVVENLAPQCQPVGDIESNPNVEQCGEWAQHRQIAHACCSKQTYRCGTLDTANGVCTP